MTNKLPQITTLILATILISGGFVVTQLAYSTGSSSDKKVEVKKVDDKKSDDKKGDIVLICHDDKEIKYIQQKDLFKQLHDHLIDPNGADVPANQKPNHPASFVIVDNPGRSCGHGDDDEDDDDQNDCAHNDGTKHEDDDDQNCGGKAGTATITLSKAVTTDNQLAPDPDPDFNLKIKNTTKTIGVPSGSTITVDAGTYQMSETQIDGYKFVLIAGDTQCPSKLDTPFIVKGGDKIECTIYNEDKFVEGQTGGEGIIFQHNSMQVKLSDPTALDSCDNPVNSPCIEIISAENGIIGIVDSALTSDTTIVLYSVIEADRLDSSITGAINPVCSISAIVQHDNESFFLKDPFDDSFPSNPTPSNVVVLKCIGMIMSGEDPDDSTKTYSPVYNVNYALIDPAI